MEHGAIRKYRRISPDPGSAGLHPDRAGEVSELYKVH
jgi:hypothetical protein